MGQRSRKRGQRPSESVPTRRAGAGAESSAGTRAPGGPGASDAPPASRSEQRAALARARLQPLGEGERPGAVSVAVVVSVVLAALIVIGQLAGARIGGRGTLAGALLLAAILLVAAWGMWRVRYWAVLGFEALLAFQIIIAALSLAVASNWWAVVLCVAVIGLGGWLFWKLVRAMARIQMPERRPSSS